MLTLDFPIRIPSALIDELCAFSGEPCCGLMIEPVICDAIRAYMKPQPAAQPQLSQLSPLAAAQQGYQWKQLFLPEGTGLRASFGKVPYFAVVQGSEIRCGEGSMSPSGFANLRGSGNRNAWKAVWLRFPGSEQWVLADTCRALQNAAINSMFTSAAPAATPAAPAAPPARPTPPAIRPSAAEAPHKNAAQRSQRGKRRKHKAASASGKS